MHDLFADVIKICAEGTNAAKKHLDLITDSAYLESHLGPYDGASTIGTPTMGLFCKNI